MIEQHEAMPLLVQACPSFEESWHEHLANFGQAVYYAAAGDFAQHLLALFQAGDLASFRAVGTTIERLHTEGSPWVREFATIGILESVQNVWSNNSVDAEQFLSFLGPESQRWWRGLNAFWGGKATSVRAEG